MQSTAAPRHGRPGEEEPLHFGTAHKIFITFSAFVVGVAQFAALRYDVDGTSDGDLCAHILRTG